MVGLLASWLIGWSGLVFWQVPLRVFIIYYVYLLFITIYQLLVNTYVFMQYLLTVGWSECLIVVLVWLAGWPVGLAGLEWNGIGIGICIGIGIGTNQPTK